MEVLALYTLGLILGLGIPIALIWQVMKTEGLQNGMFILGGVTLAGVLTWLGWIIMLGNVTII